MLQLPVTRGPFPPAGGVRGRAEPEREPERSGGPQRPLTPSGGRAKTRLSCSKTPRRVDGSRGGRPNGRCSKDPRLVRKSAPVRAASARERRLTRLRTTRRAAYVALVPWTLTIVRSRPGSAAHHALFDVGIGFIVASAAGAIATLRSARLCRFPVQGVNPPSTCEYPSLVPHFQGGNTGSNPVGGAAVLPSQRLSSLLHRSSARAPCAEDGRNPPRIHPGIQPSGVEP
jgi:hypothetical protein